MLTSLRFVKGAVATKDFVPTLQHFHIQGGTIRGYNGILGLCCPISLDLDASPKAVPFVKAIQTCTDTIQMHLTQAGKLSIKSGKFKAFIECTCEQYPEVEPEGESIQLNGGLLKVLKQLLPFIAEDASRPWARGILLRGQSAFATNNVVIIERWLGYSFPIELNIPKMAVTELLRIGEEPESMQVTENSVTFHFSGQRWLRTQTYSLQWPDLSRILDQEIHQTPIPEGLWEALENIAPFTEDLDRVFLHNGSISTSLVEGVGANVEVPDLHATGCFNIDQLKLLEGIATTVDLTDSMRPCLFYGDNVRGAIIGMRI